MAREREKGADEQYWKTQETRFKLSDFVGQGYM